MSRTQREVEAGCVYKAGEQSPDNPYKFIMSTDVIDRQGDIIEQNWDLKSFRKNPIALFQHNHNFPIGTWRGVRVESGKLVGTLQMAEKGTSNIVDEVRSLLEQRILRAVSVGFEPKEYEPLDKENPWDGIRFTKSVLLETSVVSVPANQEALEMAKSLGLSNETRKLIFGRVKADHNPASDMSSASAPKTYDDLIGESSDTIRYRNYLRENGLL